MPSASSRTVQELPADQRTGWWQPLACCIQLNHSPFPTELPSWKRSPHTKQLLGYLWQACLTLINGWTRWSQRSLLWFYPSWGKFTVFQVCLFHRFATLVNTVFLIQNLISTRTHFPPLWFYDFPVIPVILWTWGTSCCFLLYKSFALLEDISVDHLLSGVGQEKRSSSYFPHRSLFLYLLSFLLLYSGPPLIYLHLCHSAGKSLAQYCNQALAGKG